MWIKDPIAKSALKVTLWPPISIAGFALWIVVAVMISLESAINASPDSLFILKELTLDASPNQLLVFAQSLIVIPVIQHPTLPV